MLLPPRYYVHCINEWVSASSSHLTITCLEGQVEEERDEVEEVGEVGKEGEEGNSPILPLDPRILYSLLEVGEEVEV